MYMWFNMSTSDIYKHDKYKRVKIYIHIHTYKYTHITNYW